MSSVVFPTGIPVDTTLASNKVVITPQSVIELVCVGFVVCIVVSTIVGSIVGILS